MMRMLEEDHRTPSELSMRVRAHVLKVGGHFSQRMHHRVFEPPEVYFIDLLFNAAATKGKQYKVPVRIGVRWVNKFFSSEKNATDFAFKAAQVFVKHGHLHDRLSKGERSSILSREFQEVERQLAALDPRLATPTK